MLYMCANINVVPSSRAGIRHKSWAWRKLKSADASVHKVGGRASPTMVGEGSEVTRGIFIFAG
jgi:hypothetical protein